MFVNDAKICLNLNRKSVVHSRFSYLDLSVNSMNSAKKKHPQ